VAIKGGYPNRIETGGGIAMRKTFVAAALLAISAMPASA
jgi:hypothetical protein